MKIQRAWFSVVVLGLGLSGCDENAAPQVDEAVAFRSEVGNGLTLNGLTLNGLTLNGLTLNGLTLNGLTLNGLTLNGTSLNGLTLNGSSFSATQETENGAVVKTGPELEGAELQLTHNDVAYTLRFDDIYKDPSRPNDDVYFHQISIREDSVGTWGSLCVDGNNQPAAAIPIANYWNYTTGARIDDANVVTFACRGGALAKCVEWGYVPWHTAVQCNAQNSCSTISLSDHHQACTRMVRADYCGDGKSYTFDGTPIDIYDGLSPRIQTRATDSIPDWKPEAEWGPNGATCVGAELRLHMYDDANISYDYPTCLDAIDGIADCGSLTPARAASRVANAYCSKWTSEPAACQEVNDDLPE